MQLHSAGVSFDLDVRPLVVARIDVDLHAPVPRHAAMKEAMSQGADLVEPASGAAEMGAPTKDPSAARWVGVADTAEAAAAFVAAGASAVRWRGAAPPGDEVRRAVGATALIVSVDAGPGPGDVAVVAAADLERIAGIAPGAVPLVDLGAITDRAELAALVTVSLELGAQGFVTRAPSPVRRAAHVIRAVEHAE